MDVLKAIKSRFSGAPDYISSAWYWIMLLVLMGIGGGFTIWRNPQDWVEAISLGFAAPTIITKLLADYEDPSLAPKSGAIAEMRRWWAR